MELLVQKEKMESMAMMDCLDQKETLVVVELLVQKEKEDSRVLMDCLDQKETLEYLVIMKRKSDYLCERKCVAENEHDPTVQLLSSIKVI